MIAAIIVAAGKGERFGSGLPKQFQELGGVPLVARAVWAFDCCGAIGRILVALPGSHLEHASRDVFGPLRWRVRPELVEGGPERADSVRLCLDRLDESVTHVLVHDGARPLVSPQLVSRIADEVMVSGAVVAAMPERNTLKRVKDGKILETVSRAGIWEAQTPQAFQLSLLREAHASATAAGIAATDDAVLVERLGRPVSVIAGEPANFKVTTEFDLMLARSLLPLLGHGHAGDSSSREAAAC